MTGHAVVEELCRCISLPESGSAAQRSAALTAAIESYKNTFVGHRLRGESRISECFVLAVDASSRDCGHSRQGCRPGSPVLGMVPARTYDGEHAPCFVRFHALLCPTPLAWSEVAGTKAEWRARITFCVCAIFRDAGDTFIEGTFPPHRVRCQVERSHYSIVDDENARVLRLRGIGRPDVRVGDVLHDAVVTAVCKGSGNDASMLMASPRESFACEFVEHTD